MNMSSSVCRSHDIAITKFIFGTLVYIFALQNSSKILEIAGARFFFVVTANHSSNSSALRMIIKLTLVFQLHEILIHIFQ